MADEFVPTTEDVRRIWIDAETDGEYGYLDDGQQAGADFDRYLAAHDAEIREQIAREIDAKAAKCHKEGGGPCGSLWRRGMTEAAAIARGAS